MDRTQDALWQGYHLPVLYEETMAALAVRPTDIVVDGTAGGGGHSAGIAASLTEGRLIALDRDPDAVAAAGARLAGFPAVVIHSNFTRMAEVLDRLGIGRVNAVLLDLGVSSHQLDDPSRGFSFHRDGPLDMRLSRTGLSAADIVGQWDAARMADIFFRYGEEKYARAIARAIVHRRAQEPILTTLALADCIRSAIPAAARREKHPARRVFQALRIACNGELEDLEQVLDVAFDRLETGGRLAVITFHTLEQRIVKAAFRRYKQGCGCPRDFPVCVCGKTPAGAVCGPVAPSAAERSANPRCRSARLNLVIKKHDRETGS